MMKWIFIFLLLVNVVYLGWELERQAAIDRNRPVAVNSLPKSSRELELITEKDAGKQVLKAPVAPVLNSTAETGASATPAPAQGTASAPATSPETAAEANSKTTPDLVAAMPDIDTTGIEAGPGKYYCFTFGPLAEEIMAVGLRDWFKSRRAATAMRHEDQKGRQLLWIYLAPPDNRTEAMDTIRNLKDQGISDYRLIERGNLENAISLGLFSSQASVNERLQELERKGYKPIVVPYYDNKRIYWVDVKLRQTGVPLKQVFAGFPSRYNYVPVDCGKIALN